MARFSFENHVPQVSFSAWTAESSQVIGRVELKDNSSIWPGAVLRGDLESITVGVGSNVQDNAVIHTEKGFPCVVEDNVTVGHAAVLHGCTVKSGALIGMGAIVLNGAVVGENAIVGAGSLVAEGKPWRPARSSWALPPVSYATSPKRKSARCTATRRITSKKPAALKQDCVASTEKIRVAKA